jgi:hypothetical protein
VAALQCFRLLFGTSAFRKENYREKIMQFSTNVVLIKASEKSWTKKEYIFLI